jgi:hypothetical protein
MKPLPQNADLLAIAPRVIWFEEPEKALADPIRFLAYVMTYGTPDIIAVVSRYVDDDGFREAIEHAPPGILDERSWSYWNAMIGKYPAPPMPRRTFGEAE